MRVLVFRASTPVPRTGGEGLSLPSTMRVEELGPDMTGGEGRTSKDDLSMLIPTTGEVGIMAAADALTLSYLLMGVLVLHKRTGDKLGVDMTSG